MVWRNLKVWQKIGIGIGSVLLLLLLISVWSIQGLSSVVHEGQEVISGNRLRGELLQREVDHLNWVKNVSAFFLDDAVSELTVEVDHHNCGFGKWYYDKARTDAETLIPALKAPFAAIEEPHRQLHESAAQIKKLYRKQEGGAGRLEAEKVFSSVTQPSLKTIQGLLAEMNGITKKHLISEEGMMKNAMRTRAAAIVISLVAVILAVLIGVLITSSITGPLTRAVSFARQVADGNLQGTVAVASRDEVGELGVALNQMVGNLRKTVARITSSSDNVVTAADHISDGTRKLVAAARTQSSATEETSCTMMQMSSSIQSVARNCELLAGNAGEITASVTELGASSEEMAKNAETMAVSVGETSASIEQMTVSIDKVAENTEELAASVSETSATIEQMTISIDQVAKNALELQTIVQDSAGVIERMASSLGQVAKKVDQANLFAQSAAREGGNGLGSSNDAVAAMDRVAAIIEKTSESIFNLDHRSEEIGNIVKVINEIADQTNLLALNAAIEAARAGDAGRGFAVVAEEVRKLAERSVAATKEIAQVIKQVQGDTAEAVKLGKTASEEASRSMRLSGEAGKALETLVESIEQTGNLMADIAAMAAEQSSASSQVIAAVGKMSSATDVVTNAAREQAAGGRQIRVAVERMNLLTQSVTVASREQALGSRQIRIAVEKMNTITREVNRATQVQSQAIGRIAETVVAMNGMTAVVANATAEQKKGSEMVAQATENINDLARENQASTDVIGRSSENLLLQAKELKTLVAQFTV